MRYYFDPSDSTYLAVDESSRDYYQQIGKPGIREARAVAITGNIRSVCTTGVSVEWLRSCRRVARRDVPAEWLAVL